MRFQKTGKPDLLINANSSAFASYNIMHPFVAEVEGRWLMYYSGGPDSGMPGYHNHQLGLASAAVDRGTPGLLQALGLGLWVAGPAAVYFLPDDSTGLIAAQVILAGVTTWGGAAAIGIGCSGSARARPIHSFESRSIPEPRQLHALRRGLAGRRLVAGLWRGLPPVLVPRARRLRCEVPERAGEGRLRCGEAVREREKLEHGSSIGRRGR